MARAIMSEDAKTPAEKMAALVAAKKQRLEAGEGHTSGRAQRKAEQLASARSASKSKPWMSR